MGGPVRTVCRSTRYADKRKWANRDRNAPREGRACYNPDGTGLSEPRVPFLDNPTLMRFIGGLAQLRAIRQFAKFCLIGASSAVIDVGLLNVFTHLLHWHWILAQVVSFSLAVTNGFTWNSLWTFRGVNTDPSKTRYAKFYATNVAGLLLNLFVMKAVMFAMSGQLINPSNPDPLQLNVAKAVAIVVVSVWNFAASKYWTFRQSPEPGSVDRAA